MFEVGRTLSNGLGELLTRSFDDNNLRSANGPSAKYLALRICVSDNIVDTMEIWSSPPATRAEIKAEFPIPGHYEKEESADFFRRHCEALHYSHRYYLKRGRITFEGFYCDVRKH